MVLADPEVFSGAQIKSGSLSAAISGGGTSSIQISLDRIGYTAGILILRGPISSGTGAGNKGTMAMIRPAVGVGDVSALDLISYSGTYNTLVTATRLSSNMFDSNSKIYLKDTYLEPGTNKVWFLLTNADVSSRTYDIDYSIMVW